MQPLLTCVPTLAVSLLYCFWQAYTLTQTRRTSLLCRRVSFLLWQVAQTIPDENPERPRS